MPQIAKKFAEAALFASRYGNPFSILWARSFNKAGFVTVRDRKTGLECFCTVQSYRMFGEVWHDHDYEIPAVPIRKGDIVVDIGGNQGFYACYAAHQGATVHTFEPFPDTYQRLLRNIEHNGFSKLIKPRDVAVAGATSTRDLIVTDQMGGGMNTIVADFSQVAGFQEKQRLKVQTVSIESVFAEISAPRIRIVKLDCEGAEMEIIANMTLEQVERVDAFAIEYHVSYELRDLIKILSTWRNHHLAFAESTYCPKHIIRAVHRRVLAEI